MPNNKNVNNELMTLLNSSKKQIEAFPWEDKNAYSAWVSQTFYFARHTTRLLAMAGARTPFGAPEFHNRFLAHCAEEKGHDKLLVNDLKTLGSKMDEWPEMPGTCALYQTQYYYIEHHSPMAFFGYILGLEALAAHFGDYMNKRIEKAWGPKAAHFIRVHAEEDVGHTEEALTKIASLSPDDQVVVMQNLRQTLSYYDQMLNECREISRARARNAA
ncbi:iron-containing redox enzyme family protein [Bdellovibrio bacteriovorus]|uniref:iron-containing redox enzyme family protein n=1 Tax=Bdellovibrio bacteriovorus TaxID=959 RepID=UPI003D04E171